MTDVPSEGLERVLRALLRYPEAMAIPLDLSRLGIEADLDDGDQILDAVVLLRTVNPEKPQEGFVIAHTPGMSWLLQVGLVHAARAIVDQIGPDSDDG